MSRYVLVGLGSFEPELEADARHRFQLSRDSLKTLNELVTFSGIRTSRRGDRIDGVILPTTKPERTSKFPFLFAWLILVRPRRIIFMTNEGRWSSVSLSAFARASSPSMLTQLLGAPLTLAVHALTFLLLRPRIKTRSLPKQVATVLYVRTAPGYLAEVGGSVTHAGEVVRAMREIGCRVEIREAALGGSPAASLPGGRLWTVPIAARMLPGLIAMGGDLVLVRRASLAARQCEAIYQRGTPCSAAGLFLSAISGKPLILEVNSTIEYDGAQVGLGRYERLVERWNLKKASRLVVISNVLRDELNIRGVDPNRVIVNPNGVDPSRFRGLGESARDQLGFAEDDVVFGFLGSFGYWHGTKVLANAFSQLATLAPKARLLLMGDGIELAETEQILGDAGVSDRVTSMGRVESARVPELLEACDVLCSPHVPWPGGLPFHGSPTKLFEYMASGRAIVASSLGQIDDVLENEETALLVPPANPDRLADAMTRLYRDRDLREALGSAARQRAKDEHTWERNAERVLMGESPE